MSETGNYVTVDGLAIAIETARNERTGVDAEGRPYASEMPDHYGYINGTKGADGDPVDAFVGPNPDTKVAYVIDQKNADTGNFDEHKVMLGYPSREAAVADYVGSFSDGRGADRVQRVTAVSTDNLKTWLKEGDTTQPFAAQANEMLNGREGQAAGRNQLHELARSSWRARAWRAFEYVTIYAISLGMLALVLTIVSLLIKLPKTGTPAGCWFDPYNGPQCDPTCEDLREAAIYPADTPCKD